MSQMLEMPDELYAALLEVASASDLTPIDWIAVHLREARVRKHTESEQKSHPRTLADLFAGQVGRIRSGGRARLSEECRTKLTDYLEAKRQSGHL